LDLRTFESGVKIMFLNGYKTYIAAIGLFGLAVYQFSQDQIVEGVQSILAGLAAAGLRQAIGRASDGAPEVRS
jgi:hypothetical protein